MEKELLWRHVIEKKYAVSGGQWTSLLVRSSYGCSIWRSIRSLWDFFSKYVRFLAGDGMRIRFWHDGWCGRWF